MLIISIILCTSSHLLMIVNSIGHLLASAVTWLSTLTLTYGEPQHIVTGVLIGIILKPQPRVREDNMCPLTLRPFYGSTRVSLISFSSFSQESFISKFLQAIKHILKIHTSNPIKANFRRHLKYNDCIKILLYYTLFET